MMLLTLLRKKSLNDIKQSGNVVFKETVVEKEKAKDNSSLKPNSKADLDYISFLLNLLLLQLYIIPNDCLKRSLMANFPKFLNVFRKNQVNVLMIEVLQRMPNCAKFFKYLM